MRKKAISLFIILTTLVSVFPCMYVKAATAFEQYPFTSTSIMRAGATRGAKSINFDLGITSIDVYLSGASASYDLKGDLRIDGISGKVIGSFDYAKSIVPKSWGSPVNFRVQITEVVEGIHDVYLMNKSGEYNPSHIQCNYFDGSTTIYKAYQDEQTFNDIDDSEEAAKVEFLTQLGFFDAGEESFNGNLPVSRADALKTIALIFDENEYPEVPVDVFLDVEDSAVRSAAYFLYTKNVLKLEDTAYLNPSEYIKTTELVGYAANIFSQDKSMLGKISSGVLSEDGYVRRKQLVDVLYSTVIAKYEKLSSNSDGSVSYTEYTDGILSETKEWYLSEGVVTANSYTGLYSENDAVKDYYVRINDDLYSTGNTNADTYIGMLCRFIWYEDADKNITIKGIVPKYPGNIKIYSNEYDYESFSGNGITYENESGKKKDIEFSSDTKIIYNSKALPVEIESVIPDASKFRGKIIAIDNDRDEIIDVCIINNARSVVINSISNDFLIDEISGEKFEFAEEDNIEFIRYGMKLGAEEFSVGESVDIYISAGENDKFCQIILASEISGNIVSVGEEEIVFDTGKSYKLSPYANYVPTAGDAGFFKLNTFGEIVYYRKSDKSLLNVGWMIKAVGNLEEEYAGITIKTTDNKIITYRFADKLRADGVYIKELKELINGKSPFVGLANLKEQQPVLYRLDENNELNVIDTIEEGNSDIHYDQLCKCLERLSGGTYQIRKSIVFSYGSRDGGASYNDGGIAYLAKDAICYTLSQQDESFSRFGKISDSTEVNFEGYSFKKGSPKIDLAVLKQTSGKGNEYIEPLIFAGVEGVAVNDDNELVKTLKFKDATTTVKHKVNNILYKTDATYRAKVDGLKIGDMICGDINSDTNELMVWDIVHFMGNEYDGNGDTRPVEGSSGTYTSLLNSTQDSKAYQWERRMLLGNITEVDPEYIKIQRAVETQYTELAIPSTVTVLKIDENGEVVEQSSSIASVYEGQKVICFFKTGYLSRIYIYEHLND